MKANEDSDLKKVTLESLKEKHIYNKSPFGNLDSGGAELLVKKELLETILSMDSLPGIKLLVWIQKNHFNGDTIRIPVYSDALVEMGYSCKSVVALHKAKNELVRIGVLARAGMGVFWVNNKFLNL